MIPDFPDEKEKIMQFLTGYMDLRMVEKMGPFAQSPRYRHYEGDKWMHSYEKGGEDVSAYKEFVVEFSVKPEEVPGITFNDLLIKIDGYAEEMAKQAYQYNFSKIFSTAMAAGYVVDSQGQELTQENFFELLEKLQIGFDEQGKDPIGISLVGSPNQSQQLKQKLENWKKRSGFQ